MNNYENLVNQQQNIFYDKINTFIKTKTENTLIDTLTQVRNSTDYLTANELKIVGSLAYLLGLDFISQKSKPNSVVLFNVAERFKVANISKQVQEDLLQTIKVITPARLEPAKEELKNQINDKIDTDVAIKLLNIQAILKEINIPVELSLDIEKIIKTNVPTYHQVLMFNSIVYERADLPGEVVNNMLLPLIAKPEYAATLHKAADLFDQQKYAIIYLDSVVSTSEFLNSKPEAFEWLFDEKLIEKLKQSESEVSPKIEEMVEDEESNDEIVNVSQGDNTIDNESFVEEFPGQFADMSDIDEFVKGSLNEVLFSNFENRIIEKPSDLFEALDHMIKEDSEHLSNLYMFMKQNQNVPTRKSIEETFGSFNKVSFINDLNEKIDILKSDYKLAVEEYITPIESKKLNEIIKLLNELIKKLIIATDSNSKAYLIQQLIENQVETYQQLHQMTELVEACLIKGQNIQYYKAFYDTIKADEKISLVFDNAKNVDNTRVRLQAFAGLHDFYNQSSEEESLLVIK